MAAEQRERQGATREREAPRRRAFAHTLVADEDPRQPCDARLDALVRDVPVHESAGGEADAGHRRGGRVVRQPAREHGGTRRSYGEVENDHRVVRVERRQDEEQRVEWVEGSRLTRGQKGRPGEGERIPCGDMERTPGIRREDMLWEVVESAVAGSEQRSAQQGTGEDDRRHKRWDQQQ